MRTAKLLAMACVLGASSVCTAPALAQSKPKSAPPTVPAGDWIELFNGRDLSGWTPKISKHEVGENFADTFRVRDGVLQVRYDQYQSFDSQFGHLFYKTPYSYYRLVVE